MSNRLRAVTIRVEDELWDRVELLARDRRRRPAELVRMLLQDAIEASRYADVGSEIHA
jgi:predicted transcriptional regulator